MVKMMDFLTLVGFKFFRISHGFLNFVLPRHPAAGGMGRGPCSDKGSIPKYIEDVVGKTQFTLRLGLCLGIISLSPFSVQMYTLPKTNPQEKIGHVNFILFLFFLMVPSIFCIVIVGLRMC